VSPAAPRHRRPSLAVYLWLALLAAAAIAIGTNVGELRKIAHAFTAAQWQFVALAAGADLLFVLNLGRFYMTTFRASGVRAGFGRFVLLSSASHFVNLVSKTGGLGGIALYLQEARRTGEPTARATAAYMIVYTFGYGAYLVTLAFALVLLYLRGSLKPVEIAASAVILVIIAAVATVVAASLRSQTSLERLYTVAARPLNFVAHLLRRGPAVEQASLHRAAGDLFEAVTYVRSRPGSFAAPACHALAVELLSAAMLYFSAHAFHGDIGFQAALAVYAISLLFSMIAITPSGLGFVEASLSVLLVSFGMPRHNAIAAALGYRLFEFWLPALIGAASLWFVRRSLGEDEVLRA
jgi:uncharacterized protein (TIRG00374 family)